MKLTGLHFSILEYLAEVTSRKMMVKSRKIAEMLSNPSKPITHKAVTRCLVHLNKKGYVTRRQDMLARSNIGHWAITKQGCDYMMKITGGAMIYESAREYAYEVATFVYDEQLKKYVQVLIPPKPEVN